MFRRIGMICLSAAALGAMAAPALANKGGNGGSGGTTASPSSIAIASVDGTTMNAATTSPTTKLGDTLTFATTVGSLAGWEYPMVALSCYQDVNGDGKIDTSILGPDIVFSQLDKPSATFLLGGYSSIWTLRGGGDAVCRAELDAYGWKAGQESIRLLASTTNWVSAG